MFRNGLFAALLICTGPTPGAPHIAPAPAGPPAMNPTRHLPLRTAVLPPDAGLPVRWDGLRHPVPGAMPGRDICSTFRRRPARGTQPLPVDHGPILSALQAHGLCSGAPG